MDPSAFSSIAEVLKATGPYGLVAVLGWAFWRVNEKKDRELKDLHATVVKMAEAIPDPSLHDVLEVDHAQDSRPLGHEKRGCSLARQVFDDLPDLTRHLSRVVAEEALDGVHGALADLPAVDVHAAHPRVRGERHEAGAHRLEVPAAQAEPLFREHDDAAPFRGLVRQRCELRRVREGLLAHARRRQERHRLPVAQGDRAGLVEQQHVDVASRLDRASRHGQNVRLDHPVHSGDPDRRTHERVHLDEHVP
jgi:hypothetical protein